MYSVMIIAPFFLASAGALGPDAPPPRQPSVVSVGVLAHGSAVGVCEDEAAAVAAHAVAARLGGAGLGATSCTVGRPDEAAFPRAMTRFGAMLYGVPVLGVGGGAEALIVAVAGGAFLGGRFCAAAGYCSRISRCRRHSVPLCMVVEEGGGLGSTTGWLRNCSGGWTIGVALASMGTGWTGPPTGVSHRGAKRTGSWSMLKERRSGMISNPVLLVSGTSVRTVVDSSAVAA